MRVEVELYLYGSWRLFQKFTISRSTFIKPHPYAINPKSITLRLYCARGPLYSLGSSSVHSCWRQEVTLRTSPSDRPSPSPPG